MAWELDVNTRLKQENQFLRIQTAQYEALRTAIDETRHDLPAQLPVSEMELCVILQNLLENALEASRKAEGQRFIRLRASLRGDNLVLLTVENAYSGQLVEQDGVLQSTKRPGPGVGLQSVARVAGKNRGYCRFLYGSGVFTANVMLRGVRN